MLCWVLKWFWYQLIFPISTMIFLLAIEPLRWRHNGGDSVSNHQPHHCLLNRLFRRRSNKTSKLRVTGLCAGNSPGRGEFPAQMASNAENVSNANGVTMNDMSKYDIWILKECDIITKINNAKHDHMHSLWIMMTSSNGNIFRVTGTLWGESIGYRSRHRTHYDVTLVLCFIRLWRWYKSVFLWWSWFRMEIHEWNYYRMSLERISWKILLSFIYHVIAFILMPPGRE